MRATWILRSGILVEVSHFKLENFLTCWRFRSYNSGRQPPARSCCIWCSYTDRYCTSFTILIILNFSSVGLWPFYFGLTERMVKSTDVLKLCHLAIAEGVVKITDGVMDWQLDSLYTAGKYWLIIGCFFLKQIRFLTSSCYDTSDDLSLPHSDKELQFDVTALIVISFVSKQSVLNFFVQLLAKVALWISTANSILTFKCDFSPNT